MSPETERTPQAERQARPSEMFSSFGLLHLAACLGTALAVVIAIYLFD